jgi:N-acetylgalactosamine-N,N'-diacetylbacillosaminyl-diphospho-undecaprenol 4-alpha-N-acetylgalactosaminyltransferase
MCCGLPILTTNCKSGPDEIMKLKDPKTDDIMITDFGILSPIGNLELLQKGLKYCLEHPEYLQNCRTLVIKRAKDFEKETILSLYSQQILS